MNPTKKPFSKVSMILILWALMGTETLSANPYFAYFFTEGFLQYWSSGQVIPPSQPDICKDLTTREFDPLYYNSKYPDLQKAFGGDCQQLKNHWETFGKKEGRETSPTFSIKAYLARYPDLQKAFGPTNYEAAWKHWYDFGRNEGRNPAPEGKIPNPTPIPVDVCKSLTTREFDPNYYNSKYPDLQKAFGGDCQKLKDHWENFGKKEGRETSPTFSIKTYLARYPDLQKAFGPTNYTSAWKHWYDFGRGENRNPAPACANYTTREFDPIYYANAHPDLKKAFGEDCQKLKDHWEIHGKKEGRQTSLDFSIQSYLARYQDLQKAFGPTNYTAAWQHWYDYGKRENRDPSPGATLPPPAPTTTTEGGFRVLLNGIGCLACSDGATNDCEVYVEVYVDGAKIAVWGKRSMNLDGVPMDWWREVVGAFTPNTLSYSKKQYWLAPGAVWAKNSVTFKIWEQDEGGQSDNPFRDNDDFIGEFTITSATPNGNQISKTFDESGKWLVVATKITRDAIDPALEGQNALVPVRVSILDQGREGACVAFSTVAAVTSMYLNQTKPGTSREDLIDPMYLYGKRDNPAAEGMTIPNALEILKTQGVPLRSDPNKLMKIKGYRRITDRNEMRSALKSGKPLIAGYYVHVDFGAYAGEQGVYGGNISPNRVKNSDGSDARHAVMVVGYENPPAKDHSFPKWILQNSWGPRWGNNGLCRFVQGACGFDDGMYVIDEVYVTNK